MNKPAFLILAALFLTPAALLSQELSGRVISPLKVQPGVSAVEFPSTTNASLAAVPFVTGYRFTVTTPVLLNTLGAVLQDSSAAPVFGTLPASLHVSLWDDARNLLATATVSAIDPLVGHFNYHPVTEISLRPGITYTIAALVSAGSSVLSDVPDFQTGAAVVFGGALSVPSSALVFPTEDTIGRNSYFGASFTYLIPALVQDPITILPKPVRNPTAPMTAPAVDRGAAPPIAPAGAAAAAPIATPAVDPADPAGSDAAASASTPKARATERAGDPK